MQLVTIVYLTDTRFPLKFLVVVAQSSSAQFNAQITLVQLLGHVKINLCV